MLMKRLILIKQNNIQTKEIIMILNGKQSEMPWVQIKRILYLTQMQQLVSLPQLKAIN